MDTIKWKQIIGHYGDILKKRYETKKMGKTKLVRLAVKHKQWINMAVERGIYHD